MRFEQVLGLKPTKAHLLHLCETKRVPHALLFEGNEGAGALPLAIAFAQYLVCKNPTPTDSCGTCSHCRRMAELAHPDFNCCLPSPGAKSGSDAQELYITQMKALRTIVSETGGYFSERQWYEQQEGADKQGVIGVSESDRILETLRYKSFDSPYRLVLVWLPERMHPAAADRLLKLIEEPPEGAIFLFVSNNPADIKATILSRLQRITVPPVPTADLATELVQEGLAREEDAIALARIAGGSLIRARELATQSTGVGMLETFKQLMRTAYSKDPIAILDWVDEQASMGREALKELLRYIAQMLRAAYMLNIDQEKLAYASEPEREFLERFAPYVNGRNIGFLFDELNTTLEHAMRNAYPKILLSDFAFRISGYLGKNLR